MKDMNHPTALLIQRFIDQELSPEERVAFIARVGRDEALRRRVLALETMALETRRLPRPIVPSRFTADVIARLDGERTAWTSFVQRLFAPRTLQWNLATGVAAACVLVAAVAAAAAGLGRGSAPMPPVATAAAPTVLVRLVVLQPQARTVEVAGDFNGWEPARTPLEQTAGGAWTVTLPLEPGRYEYMFVVDGHEWVVDPFAMEQTDDGFGSRNAVLDVRPLSPRSSS